MIGKGRQDDDWKKKMDDEKKKNQDNETLKLLCIH